jgi:hypothetical protein
MILKPAVVGTISVLIWLYLRNHGICFRKESDNPVLATIGISGILYSILSVTIIARVWELFGKLSYAVVTKNKAEFLAWRDEQIPRMLHLAMGILGFFPLVLVMTMHYEEKYLGMLCVFLMSFIETLLSIIAIELDNPLRSIWFMKKTPPDWMTANVEFYFDECKRKAELKERRRNR